MAAQRIEEWFKNALSREPVDQDAWDIPSQQVWEGVAAAIRKRRRRLLFWWWFGGVGSLLILGGLLLVFYNKNEWINSSKTGNAIDPPILPTAVLEEKPCPPDAENQITHILEKKKAIEHRDPAITTMANTRRPIEKALVNENIAQVGIGEIAPSEGQQLLSSGMVDLIPTTSPGLLPPVSRSEHLMPKVLKNRAVNYWAAGYFSIPIRVKIISSGEVLPLNSQGRESSQWEQEFGIQGGVSLGKWRFYSGVGKYGLSLHTEQITRIVFNPQEERPVNDNTFESTYALSIPSSYGNADTEVDLRRDRNTTVDAGSIVMVRIQTDQQLKYLEIPFGLSYLLLQKGHFYANAGGGLFVNKLRSQNGTLTAESRHAQFNLRRIRALRQANSVDDLRWDYWLNAELGYRFDTKVSAFAAPAFRQSFTPLSELRTATSQVGGFSLFLGLRYTF